MFTESYFPLYSRSKAAIGSSLVEKPTNPTSVFLNLKSSIDTPQGSEKCCSLFSSWLSTPSTFWSVSFLFPFHPALAVPGSANTEWTIYRSHPALQCVCVLYSFTVPQSAQWLMWWILIFQTFFFINNLFFYHECIRIDTFSVFCEVWICSQMKNSHTKAPNTYWWMRIWVIWIPLMLFAIIMFIHTVIAKSAQDVRFWVN